MEGGGGHDLPLSFETATVTKCRPDLLPLPTN